MGTPARAIASVFSGGTTNFPKIVEVGVFNTTTTAVAVSLNRFTAAGSVGAGLTEVSHDGSAVVATGFAGHTADGTVGNEIVRASLGASIGSGVVWTFGAGGVLIPAGTANGIGVIIPTGTGQILDYYFVWDE